MSESITTEQLRTVTPAESGDEDDEDEDEDVEDDIGEDDVLLAANQIATPPPWPAVKGPPVLMLFISTVLLDKVVFGPVMLTIELATNPSVAPNENVTPTPPPLTNQSVDPELELEAIFSVMKQFITDTKVCSTLPSTHTARAPPLTKDTSAPVLRSWATLPMKVLPLSTMSRRSAEPGEDTLTAPPRVKELTVVIVVVDDDDDDDEDEDEDEDDDDDDDDDGVENKFDAVLWIKLLPNEISREKSLTLLKNLTATAPPAARAIAKSKFDIFTVPALGLTIFAAEFVTKLLSDTTIRFLRASGAPTTWPCVDTHTAPPNATMVPALAPPSVSSETTVLIAKLEENVQD